MSNPSKEVMRRSVDGHLTELERLTEFDRGYQAGRQAMDAERQKAVCQLRKIHTDAGGFVKALAKALDVEWQAPRVHQTLVLVRDRLIHLLGGDQPSGIDVLRESRKNGDNCKVEASDSVESSKYAGNCKSGHSRTCPESNEEVSESTPSVSITDELRRKTAEAQGLRHECSTYRDMLLIASDELGSIKKHLDEIVDVLDGRD